MEHGNNGGRGLGLRWKKTRTSGHASARPVLALYLIRARAKESAK
jgi:hypothetical protein